MTYFLNSAKMALLLAVITAAPAVLSAQPRCGLHTIQGSYGFYYTSGIPGGTPYGIGVGVVTFDGAGKGTSTETASVNPLGIFTATSSVEYTVDPDCTGTITWTYPPEFGNLVVNAKFVITDNGKGFYTIGTDAGSMSYGVFTRQ